MTLVFSSYYLQRQMEQPCNCTPTTILFFTVYFLYKSNNQLLMYRTSKSITVELLLHGCQNNSENVGRQMCDQMATLLFNLWPFKAGSLHTTLQICFDLQKIVRRQIFSNFLKQPCDGLALCNSRNDLRLVGTSLYCTDSISQQHKNAKVGTKVWQIPNEPSKKCPNTFKILPKWRNFALFGHTGSRRVISNNQSKNSFGFIDKVGNVSKAAAFVKRTFLQHKTAVISC